MRRIMLAMSQEHLADALGITYQQVQKCEKGANLQKQKLGLVDRFGRRNRRSQIAA